MKKLLVFTTVLATASMAHGFTFGLVESAAQQDLGSDTQLSPCNEAWSPRPEIRDGDTDAATSRRP
jgi:hypothetical protein